MVKLRFAPSPTGHLHVGNFRTALINFLFAKKNSGHFLLRIDDTDTDRSNSEFEQSIKDDLNWSGINWDSEKKQSLRLDRYKEILDDLIQGDYVYPCFETPEELSLKRKSLLSSGKPPVYDRSSLKLSKAEINRKIEEGLKPHYRFKLKLETVIWKDLIRGELKYNMKNVSDPILVREDGRFIYTLASVIDDIDFEVTHIIRGEDHITNSAVQIQIFNTLRSTIPTMGHLSLMTDFSGEGLSKREGSLSVKELITNNIHSMTLNSYLSSIGSSKNVRLKDSLEMLINDFNISDFSRAPTKFNYNDLKALNSKYFQQLSFEDLQQYSNKYNLKLDKKAWDIIKTNISSLDQLPLWNEIIYGTLNTIDIDKKLKETFLMYLPSGDLNNETWKEWTNSLEKNLNIKKVEIFKSLRNALTGSTSGPEMSELIQIMGKEKILERLT